MSNPRTPFDNDYDNNPTAITHSSVTKGIHVRTMPLSSATQTIATGQVGTASSLDQIIEFKRYGSSKPRRVILKGKIAIE